MVYISTAIIGFLFIHLLDLVSLKRVPGGVKPLTGVLGYGLVVYSMIMVYLSPDKLRLPVWSVWVGWGLLIISLVPLLYSLFLNLPFRKTYISIGPGDKLVKTGIYSLVRHPGVLSFSVLAISLILVSQSRLMLITTPILILLDVVLVVIQDRVFFTRMFDGYKRYQQETPMLIPNRRSASAFINSIRQARNA